MRRLSLFFLIAFFSSISLALDSDKAIEIDAFVNDYLDAYAKGVAICDEYMKKRPPPSEEIIYFLKKMPKKEMMSYLRYMHADSGEKCIMAHGGIDLVFLLGARQSEDLLPETKKKIEIFMNLISRPASVEDVIATNKINPERLMELQKIKYFETPFSLIVMAELLHEPD